MDAYHLPNAELEATMVPDPTPGDPHSNLLRVLGFSGFKGVSALGV
jgi:hypothetical protein